MSETWPADLDPEDVAPDAPDPEELEALGTDRVDIEAPEADVLEQRADAGEDDDWDRV